MKLQIISDSRDSAILVCDEDHNDIAEFYHNEHATVGQSYETALALARWLVGSPAHPVAWRCRTTDEPQWQYGETPLLAKDIFRKEHGFEEQPLYAAPIQVVEDDGSYEQAPMGWEPPKENVARKLIQDLRDQGYEIIRASVFPPEICSAIMMWMECPPELRPSPRALGLRIEEIASTLTPAADFIERDAPFTTCIMIVEEECRLDKKPDESWHPYVLGGYDVGTAIVDRIKCAQRYSDEKTLEREKEGR